VARTSAPLPPAQGPPASAKQLAYLRDIAARRGMTLRELDDQAVAQCRVDTIDTLVTQGKRMLATYLASLDPEEEIEAVSMPSSVPLVDADGTRLDKPHP